MALLDLLFGGQGGQGGQGGGLLSGLLGQQQPQAQQPYDWMQSPQNPLNRRNQILGYLAGALQPGSPGEQISRGLAGYTQGATADLLAQQRLDALTKSRAQTQANAALIDKIPNLTPEQKNFFLQNPKAAEEYAKALINPGTTTIGQTVLQNTPFGAPKPVYVEPYKPELVDQFDPATGRMVKAPYQLPQPHFQQQAPAGASAGGRSAQLTAPGPAGGFYSAPSTQEKEESQSIGKGLGEQYMETQKQASNATRTLTTLQRLSQLSPKAYEGAAAPTVQFFRSYLKTFGIDDKKVPVGEEVTALSNQLVLDATGGSLGAQISNSDRDYMAARFPQLANTAEGRRELIETLSLLEKRKIEVGKLATEYRKKSGTFDGFSQFMAEYAEKNPLFKDREQATAAPASSSAPAAGAFKDGMTATNPKTGAKIIFKGGQWQPAQ